MRVARWTLITCFLAGLFVATTGLSLAQRPAAKTHATALVKVGMTGLGKVLVDAQGFTLYHRVTENTGTISCKGPCLTFWPPLLLPAGMKVPTGGKAVTDKLGVIKRPDISPTAKQVTYDGWPLYVWHLDTKPGQTTGEGIGHFVVVPQTPLVTFSLLITTTSGETWGKVKLQYTYQKKKFSASCNKASCTYPKIHAGVSVKLTETPTSPGNWRFDGWMATPVDGGVTMTPKTTSITIKSNDSYTIHANYVIG
jgi:predicted lipoprotein with Yx(FWY)xxD motif